MTKTTKHFGFNSMHVLAGACGLFTLLALAPISVAQQIAAAGKTAASPAAATVQAAQPAAKAVAAAAQAFSDRRRADGLAA